MPLALRQHIQMMPGRLDVSRRKPNPNCVLSLPGADQLTYGNGIVDRSGYGNHGTVVGALWNRLPSGLWYLSCDGTEDYVQVADAPSLSALPLVAAKIWMRGTVAKAYAALMGKYYHATDREFVLFATWGRTVDTAVEKSPRFYVYDQSADAYIGGYITAKTDLFDGIWHQLVGIFDGSAISFVVDGVSSDATAANSGTFVAIEDGARPVMVGRQENLTARDFQGSFALPELYNINPPVAFFTWLFEQERALFGR